MDLLKFLTCVYLKATLLMICIFAIVSTTVSQTSLAPSDTFDKKRFFTMAAAGTIIYGATVVGLNQAWYKDFERTSFHFFNDAGEWQNMDKMGHLFTTYFETELSYRGLRWAGVNDHRAIWWSAGLGLLYQTTIEVFDAHSARWGFSIYDMLYNLGGAALFTGQQLSWNEQRIRFRISSWPKNYPNAPLPSSNSEEKSSLSRRADDLFGKGFLERYLKDYNAQTIWLSFNVNGFFPNSNLPQWLNISIGYGSENLFGGYANSWKEGIHSYTLSENKYPREKQWYLSPDIDFRKIKTNSALLRTAFTVLNIFKIPSPALEYNSGGKFKWHWLFL